METIQQVRNLLPYFRIADEEAKKSPCIRRQYGAVIVWPEGDFDNYVVGANYRLSDCCNGVCVRNTYNTFHGGRVELGAEVHAETAALIKYPGNKDNSLMVLAGWIGDKMLTGSDVYACHTCSLNLKFAGFDYIYIRDDAGVITPVLVKDMIARREAEWIDDRENTTGYGTDQR